MAAPRTSLFLAAAVAALALAGCSSNSMSTSSGSAAAEAAGGGAAGAPAARGSAGTPGAAPVTAGGAPAAAVRQRVIRTAQVVVQVDGELAPAATKVRAVAQGLGGFVSSETTTFADSRQPGTTVEGEKPGSPESSASSGAAAPSSGPPAPAHPGQSVIVLRVPESSVDRALTLISGPGGVGKELSRSASAQDVTGDLADLQSRVATQRASVERVRALLGKAGSLRDVVLLESEVSKREADLEALEARRAALADRADLATLTVDLRTPAAAAAVTGPADRNAFLEGLDSGWKALVASLTVILTILGALLPLAILAAIVGGPLLWALRRRRGSRPAAPAQAPAPAPTPGAGS